MLAMTLYYLAHCTTLKVLMNTFGCAESTAWNLVGEGVAAIVLSLHFGVGSNTPVIRFSQTEQEILWTVGGFDSFIGHLPWVIGALDGTVSSG